MADDQHIAVRMLLPQGRCEGRGIAGVVFDGRQPVRLCGRHCGLPGALGGSAVDGLQRHLGQ